MRRGGSGLCIGKGWHRGAEGEIVEGKSGSKRRDAPGRREGHCSHLTSHRRLHTLMTEPLLGDIKTRYRGNGRGVRREANRVYAICEIRFSSGSGLAIAPGIHSGGNTGGGGKGEQRDAIVVETTTREQDQTDERPRPIRSIFYNKDARVWIKKGRYWDCVAKISSILWNSM